MNLVELKKQQKEQYIKDNELEQSYLPKAVLWQCRPLLPEVIMVGKDEKGNIIFFEETKHSLQKRHYGETIKATNFNLVYYNGEKAELVTRNYLVRAKISYNDGFDLVRLNKFLDNNTARFNALGQNNGSKRKRYSYNLTEQENEIVREFVRKMRLYGE